MKRILLVLILFSTYIGFTQNNQFWQKKQKADFTDIKLSRQNLPTNQTYSLNIGLLKQILSQAPERGGGQKSSNIIISFPNENGEFERFRITKASVLHPDLAAKYPDINSYAGQGVDNPAARIRFSVSPLGLQSMRLLPGAPATFIEPYTNDLSQYTVYKRADKLGVEPAFECLVENSPSQNNGANNNNTRNADDALLRTYRLAVSTTGEYTAYHGGTKAGALAAMNTTMTRVNGVYETDFNVTMVLIANTDDVIYTNSSTDPYGNTTSGYNSQLQNTLTNVIGEANYDVGHLFANLQNNGNAGCIGCVCVNGQKGSGWTSHTVPENDPFDIDYVAHELGHQFGGNHTWTHGGNEGTNVQMEPGSGSTIMGYAGITGANTDVQQNSDPYFHAISIQQITNYIKSQSCSVNTNTGNAIPTVSAGSNYTIPKGTAFVLEGTGSDSNTGDVLTYCWEQIDENNSATNKPSVTNTTGPAFRSYEPTTESNRYFPRLETIKTGATAWEWEAVPNVARQLNFRLTVRDNRVGGGANNSDDTQINVNGTAGPFVVNSPNTNVTWNAGTSQTVNWDVAGTTGNGVNASSVDIFLSTDGGDTYPITLASGVTNNGSHDIIVPDNQGTQNRIMVRGTNHIFFDISNTNFTIGAPVNCNASVPVNLIVSNISDSSVTLSWDAVSGATYDVRFRESGTTTWTTNTTTGISLNLTGLAEQTTYEAQVRSKCADGSQSAFSSSINFTTTEIQLIYCDSNGNNTNDEYISRVELADIDNASGAGTGGYSDFTAISTNITKGDTYTISITPTWTGTLYNEAYAVWIDYNKDGDFNDGGEQVFSQSPTQNTPVSGSFTIPIGANEGATRMRVSMKYNAAPTPCESFTYGEVEDYTVNVIAGIPDTEAPVITLSGNAAVSIEAGNTYNDAGATAFDNIDGDITASITTVSTVDTSVEGVYTVTYNVSDAAGNNAIEVVRTVTVTADETIPVITLLGNSVEDITINDIYTDAGATAFDSLDGDITSDIVTINNVDSSIAGTYTVTFNVSDAAGNNAIEVVRTVNVTEAPSGCTGGISSFPYSEGFESNFGEWTQSTADDINWTRDSNGTPSSNTGPASASQGSFYVYVEASGNGTGYPNKRAILNSPCYNLSGITEAYFNFKYHMFGSSDMGSIDLEISTDAGNSWSSIWTETGNKGNQWLSASINLSSYVGTSIQLRFNRLTGGTWQADIAIDDIELTDSAAPPAVGCAGGESLPYLESYESNLGNWTQASGDDLDWTRDSNGTPSNGTGPSNGADGSFYIYVEASGNGTGYPNKRAIINSPCIDLSGASSASYNFSYHMRGTNNLGSIDLEISTDNGQSWASIWSQTGNQGNSWNNVTLDLSAYVGGGVQFRYNRLTGNTWQADVAIDNVSITTSTAARDDDNTTSQVNEENVYTSMHARIFPNPVKGNILNIEITGAEGEKYTIYNMRGQIIGKGSFTNSLEVGKLQAGVYLIEIISNNQTVIKRFIKQ